MGCTNQGQNWHTTASPQNTLTSQISFGSVYSVALEKWKPPILPRFQVWYPVMAPPSDIETSLNAGAQLQTFRLPLYNDIKAISHFQRLFGEVVLSSFALQEHNGQIDRQTDSRVTPALALRAMLSWQETAALPVMFTSGIFDHGSLVLLLKDSNFSSTQMASYRYAAASWTSAKQTSTTLKIIFIM